ncbi:MAG: thiamine pyrophosphate-binding protein, partial [Gemmatimonadetes bacterium]|nr:thiamine pyrophosphate-binding protein [Gemmatimonadota bacterium]
GRVAPVIVTKGPGLLNTVGAIANAMHDSIPILLLSGATSTHILGKGSMQEIYYKGFEDAVSIFRPVTKGAWLTVRPDTVIETLNHAYRIAVSGRPGPVLVQLPLDVQCGSIEGDIEVPATRTVQPGFRAPAAGVEAAAGLVAAAARPVLLVGGGVNRSAGAIEAIRRLADEFRLPTTTTLTAKGALPETHPLALGPVGRSGAQCAADVVREADILVAVGARFSDNHTSNWRNGMIYNIPPTRMIHVDVDPAEIGRNYPIELGLQSDAGAFLTDLADALDGSKTDRPDWLARVARAKQEWEDEAGKVIHSTSSPIHPGRLAAEVGEVLAERGRVIVDIGDIIQYAEPYMCVRRPGQWLVNPGMAEMGWATQGAVAAALADPGSPAVVLTGDGAFLMGPQVLATSIEYGLPAVWVVINNREFAIERKGAGAAFGRIHPWISFTTPDGRPYNPDFAALARSFGASGAKVTDAADFRPALEAAIADGGPYVLDVDIDQSIPTYFTKGLDRAYPTNWAGSYPAVGQMRVKA